MPRGVGQALCWLLLVVAPAVAVSATSSSVGRSSKKAKLLGTGLEVQEPSSASSGDDGEPSTASRKVARSQRDVVAAALGVPEPNLGVPGPEPNRPSSPPARKAAGAAAAARGQTESGPRPLVQDAASWLLTSTVETYGIIFVIMVGLVCFMYYHKGLTVILQVIAYISSLALIKISLKNVFSYGWEHPQFLTAIHLLASSIVGFIIGEGRRLRTGVPMTAPSKDEFFYGILPIAVSFGLSIGAENGALLLVSAAFSEVVAATNPVVSAFLTWAMGLEFHHSLLAPIAVVVIGCVVSIAGELHFSGLGLAILMFSVFCRGIKVVLQQKLMGDSKLAQKFDPVMLMAWTCGLAFVTMIMYSLVVEGLAPIQTLRSASNPAGLTFAISVSTVCGCGLNALSLYVVKELGAVGMQMVSQIKSMLVVLGGIFLLGESFTYRQQAGFLLTLIGVAWYSRMHQQLELKGGKL